MEVIFMKGEQERAKSILILAGRFIGERHGLIAGGSYSRGKQKKDGLSGQVTQGVSLERRENQSVG